MRILCVFYSHLVMTSIQIGLPLAGSRTFIFSKITYRVNPQQQCWASFSVIENISVLVRRKVRDDWGSSAESARTRRLPYTKRFFEKCKQTKANAERSATEKGAKLQWRKGSKASSTLKLCASSSERATFKGLFAEDETVRSTFCSILNGSPSARWSNYHPKVFHCVRSDGLEPHH